MKKITVPLLLTAVALAACTPEKRESELTIISNENIRTHSDRGLVPDMVEDWDFIRLETSEASLLHERPGIAIDNGLIFVYSRPNNVNVGDTPVALKVFDTQGKYLYNIGIFGRAANNYLVILAWALDKANKQVVILDYDKILKYDYQGNLLETFPKDKGFGFGFSNFDYLPDGNIMEHNIINGGSNVQIRLMDGNFNTIDTLARRGFTTDDQGGFGMNGTNWLSIHGDHVMVAKDLTDTIYTYRDGRLHPELFIEFSHSMDGVNLVDGMSRSQAQAQLEDAKHREKKMSDIRETDQYYVLENSPTLNNIYKRRGEGWDSQTLVWDKDAGRGILLGDGDPVSQIPVGPIIYVDGDWLVTCIEAYRILEYKEACAERGTETTPQMSTLFQGLKDTDNPVIIRYKLKTDSELF